MRALFVVSCLALAACETEPPPRGPDLSTAPGDLGDHGPDFAMADLAATLEFEDFVLSLIQTQTSDSTLPTKTEDKTFVDSMDPAKFDVLF